MLPFWARLVIFIVGLVVGIGCERYTYQIVQTVGKSAWAERYLGDTYNMWKLIGVAVIIAVTVYLVRL